MSSSVNSHIVLVSLNRHNHMIMNQQSIKKQTKNNPETQVSLILSYKTVFWTKGWKMIAISPFLGLVNHCSCQEFEESQDCHSKEYLLWGLSCPQFNASKEITLKRWQAYHYSQNFAAITGKLSPSDSNPLVRNSTASNPSILLFTSNSDFLSISYYTLF